MKSFQIVAAILSLSVTTFAQDIRQLPQCAQGPVLDAISATGCPLTDIACICAKKGFISGLLASLPAVCTPPEIDASGSFAVKLCGAAGVTVTVPAVSSSVPSPTPSGNGTTPVVSATQTSSRTTTSATSTAVPNSGMIRSLGIEGGIIGVVVACIAAW